MFVSSSVMRILLSMPHASWYFQNSVFIRSTAAALRSAITPCVTPSSSRSCRNERLCASMAERLSASCSRWSPALRSFEASVTAYWLTMNKITLHSTSVSTRVRAERCNFL